MHEGKKLDELLTRYKHSYKAFAEAAGVSPPRVSQYVRMEKFPPQAWESVAVGLRELGIDVRELRPTGGSAPLVPASLDLRSCLKGLSTEQLRNVLTILRADSESRERIAWVIEDRLDRDE
jgi:hypothetical protein